MLQRRKTCCNEADCALADANMYQVRTITHKSMTGCAGSCNAVSAYTMLLPGYGLRCKCIAKHVAPSHGAYNT